MAQDNNHTECERWLRQAEQDLAAANVSRAGEQYEWACFQAQQSAEKSLTAILHAREKRVIQTHSVLALVRTIGANDAAAGFEQMAKRLDNTYISSRYPNDLAEHHPSHVFLHGSYSCGDVHELSDIDIVIVGDFEGRVFDRMTAVKDIYYDTAGLRPPLEAFVYTDAKFNEMRAEGRHFIAHVLDEGKE